MDFQYAIFLKKKNVDFCPSVWDLNKNQAFIRYCLNSREKLHLLLLERKLVSWLASQMLDFPFLTGDQSNLTTLCTVVKLFAQSIGSPWVISYQKRCDFARWLTNELTCLNCVFPHFESIAKTWKKKILRFSVKNRLKINLYSEIKRRVWWRRK